MLPKAIIQALFKENELVFYFMMQYCQFFDAREDKTWVCSKDTPLFLGKAVELIQAMLSLGLLHHLGEDARGSAKLLQCKSAVPVCCRASIVGAPPPDRVIAVGLCHKHQVLARTKLLGDARRSMQASTSKVNAKIFFHLNERPIAARCRSTRLVRAASKTAESQLSNGTMLTQDQVKFYNDNGEGL